MNCLTRRPLIFAVAPIVCFATALAAHAQDASAWDKESHAAARLISGSLVKTTHATWIRAGIEIKLDAGWKTYWRDPGDSGVPPTFDFSSSTNVKATTVLWPAPERFPDGAGGNSIGYRDHVILPLRVTLNDAGKPATVHLKLNYAVCGKLCVPAEANLELALSGRGAEDASIESAEKLVPRRTALGAGGDLFIRSVHRESGTPHERVMVEVAAPEGAEVDLFAEGPTAEWALPLPEPRETDGKIRRFTFELDGLPPGATARGATLTLTAISGDDAIEVPVHLD